MRTTIIILIIALCCCFYNLGKLQKKVLVLSVQFEDERFKSRHNILSLNKSLEKLKGKLIPICTDTSPVTFSIIKLE